MTYRLAAKELRENFVWALIAFVIGMVVIFLRRAPGLLGPLSGVVLREAAYRYPTYSLVLEGQTVVLPLLWPTEMMAMFCVLWGVALGLAQTLPDAVRNTWQVLFTLPVTRFRVLGTKVATGVLLYLLSVGVPFVLLVWRAATPGHYPSPFRVWMLGPGLAAISCGLCAYAGALLTVMRPARWYVSRGAPLIAAGGICFFKQAERFCVELSEHSRSDQGDSNGPGVIVYHRMPPRYRETKISCFPFPRSP